MAKKFVTNEGAQRAFVMDKSMAAAYMGGIGAGKTWSLIVKGLTISTQTPIAPGTMWGPRGAIGASTFPALRKIVLPQFFDIMSGSGLWKTGKKDSSYVKSEYKARLKANCGCRDRVACDHEAEIYLVSLEDPDEIRGMELSWYGIDEGRNTSKKAWQVLWGRLRQQGYPHQGFNCSTPNGFDWQWEQFHPESPNHLAGASWYNAPTPENKHLPPDYVPRLAAEYHGRFYEQEVMGRFVGLTEGGVFFEWDRSKYERTVQFDPSLPLYSEWDFGMGDLTVILFFQLLWNEVRVPNGPVFMQPTKLYVGALEGADTISGDWAKEFLAYSRERFGTVPVMNIGDPAGRQRNQVSGSSVIEDLNQHGITLVPAPKKPVDYAVRILNNMMADGRVLVDKDRCERLSAALASHKWKLDKNGQKTSNEPVHDWTSHYADAARYGTTVLIPQSPTTKPEDVAPEPQPGTAGHAFARALNRAEEAEEEWLGSDTYDPEDPVFHGVIRPRSA